MKNKIIDILSTIFEKDVDTNCSFETEEAWDSLAHLQIVIALEEEFETKIPTDKIPELSSVENIARILNELC